MSNPLGRRVPQDFSHVDKYPLSALPANEQPKNVPVVIGVAWYTNFDAPVKDGNAYWVGRGDLGTVRGGHCVCLKPKGMTDPTPWWKYYDQGREGACVGFGASRMMSMLNRKRYDARWLWNESKIIDQWADTNPGDDNGTSVRAACDILRDRGHCRVVAGKSRPEAAGEGISANRWATSIDEVLSALGTPDRDYVEVLNSWGKAYPHIVRMPASTLERLLREDGEIALVVDR